MLFELESIIGFMPHWSEFPQEGSYWLASFKQSRLNRETFRLAARVALALEAWKLRHGSLPKTLDELVGPYLDRAPVDPYSGQPFRYFRDGLPLPLHWRQPQPFLYYSQDRTSEIPARTPLIWSVGANVQYNESLTSKHLLIDDYLLRMRDVNWQNITATTRPRSEFEIWEAGWPFPVP